MLTYDNGKGLGGNEAVTGDKKDIELKDIIREKTNNKVLILGGAGVGKSTLMQKIAYEWGMGNKDFWSDRFDYVYKISLKQLLRENCKKFLERFYDLEEKTWSQK